jgi:hypothetical protein
LKAAAENLSMLEQVANDLLEATSSDPVLVAISARLCQGMITQNNILCSLISSNASCNHGNQENVSISSRDLGAIPKNSHPSAHNNTVSNNSSQSLSEAEKNRRPLKQLPIGISVNNSKWQEVSNRRSNKGKSAAQTDGNQPDVQDKSDNNTDFFSNAVRNAEKSVVIYNLNLGQTPLLNPSTISAKVTSALIKAAADNFLECGNNTVAAGEMVNDLISQVKGMDLLGKGTKPCKDPRDASRNASFYTIPVKLTFSNKQVSKQVNEILRQKYKVSTSIPYHRTLKQAITMAHEKISKLNPGKQVLISLDAPKKCLKPFIRLPPAGSNRTGDSGWSPAGNPIPLPADALNPKLREIPDDFSLPTSPTLANTNSNSDPPVNNSGTVKKILKMTPEVARQVEELRKQKESEAGSQASNDDLSNVVSAMEVAGADEDTALLDESQSGPRPEV